MLATTGMRLRSGGGTQREKFAAPANLKIRKNPWGQTELAGSVHFSHIGSNIESQRSRDQIPRAFDLTEERKGVLLAEMDVEMDVNQMYNADGAPVGFDNGQQGGGRGPGGRGR